MTGLRRATDRLVGRRLSSVRAKTTIVGVLVVGAALAIGAVGLLSLLRISMTEGVETTARAQLNDVGALLQLGDLPTRLPSGPEGTFTQVVSAEGRVVATSATLVASTPISHLHPGEEGQVIDTLPTLAAQHRRDADGPYLLLAASFPAPALGGGEGPVTVYVAATLHSVDEATTTVSVGLAVGLPVLVVLVAGLIWLFGGRALRPVEVIRAEVADISGRDLHRRVPVPSTQDEVARLARTMNEMLDRLDRSAAAQRQFVADASHELRSPLATLQAALEVAIAHPESGSLTRAAADALEESQRLQRLVEDLLVLAATDEGTPVAAPREVDLDELVLSDGRRRRLTSLVAIDMRKVSGGRVAGNPDQLARMVHNLLDNAQRHAQSRVSVELATVGDEVLLAVEDDGPGIPVEERERIFERFARLDEARDQDSGGTGLGLSIVRDLVAAHGGTVTAMEGASGARFEVRLPSSEAALPPRSGSGVGGPRRLLDG